MKQTTSRNMVTYILSLLLTAILTATATFTVSQNHTNELQDILLSLEMIGVTFIDEVPYNSFRTAYNELQSTQQNQQLRPLVRDAAHLRERDLHGDWIGTKNDLLFGFQLLETRDQGPFTVIQLEETEDGLISRLGHFEVLVDGRLRMVFIQEMDENGDIREVYEEEESWYWNLRVDDIFIYLERDGFELILSRLDQ